MSAIDSLIILANSQIAYNENAKAGFHKHGKQVAKLLADALGLKKGEYDIRSNQGGIAVSGEITLHSDTLYVQFSQSGVANGTKFMWRTCKGRKDYTGGNNQWAKWEDLNNLASLARVMNDAAKAAAIFAANPEVKFVVV